METPTHIIGRGANDCKAGVALILLLAHFAKQPGAHLSNVIFLLSYREEGNREKTSTAIGECLGHAIPLSARRNLLLCLENTTKVEAPYSIGIYDAEPCNIFIEITARLADVRRFLLVNTEWKSVSAQPVSGLPNGSAIRQASGTSGHTATVSNEDNVIYQAIMTAGDAAVMGGDFVQTSVVQNSVRVFAEPAGELHKVVLNFRGLREVEEVRASLCNLDYRERFPFRHAAGSDRRRALAESGVKDFIDSVPSAGIHPQFMTNPGRSDASAIWNATDQKDRLDILTMGPGSRSHIDNGVARKTHGPDEGFHKESGHIAARYIVDLVQRFLRDDRR
jgi:acetylornithine deacetylase/succinyl-diaminopimelate desuccinylase-like protein